MWDLDTILDWLGIFLVLFVALGCGESVSAGPAKEPVEEVQFLSPAGLGHLMV